MIERSHADPRPDVPRDERSMRVMEYALAFVSLAAAILLALR
jgi:hypothetical protein